MFVDLCGPKHVSAAGDKRHTVIIRDEFARFTWLKFLRNKLDVADAFKKFLADTRTEGDVEIVRGECRERFSQVSVDNRIKQAGIHEPRYPPVLRRGGAWAGTDRDVSAGRAHTGRRSLPDQLRPEDGISVG